MTPEAALLSPAEALPADEMAAEEPRAHPAPSVRRALQGARPTLGEIADALGIPKPTLNAYLNGQRRPSKLTRLLLAAYCRNHARRLEALADELTEETEDEPG